MSLTSYIGRILVLFCCIQLQFIRAQFEVDYFGELEKALSGARTTLIANKLHEDFVGGADNPKEIEIHCPGEPIVSIRDLVADTAAGYEGDCVVVKMHGINFSFKMVINCEKENKFEFQ